MINRKLTCSNNSFKCIAEYNQYLKQIQKGKPQQMSTHLLNKRASISRHIQQALLVIVIHVFIATEGRPHTIWTVNTNTVTHADSTPGPWNIRPINKQKGVKLNIHIRWDVTGWYLCRCLDVWNLYWWLHWHIE